MLFAIHCLDKPGQEAARAATMDAHRAYLGEAPVEIVMSGPLVSDDGADVIGSLFVIEAPDRAAIMAVHHDDPLYKAGVWETVNIHAFVKRVG